MYLVKKKFGLIGNPVLHSISPFIHKRLFEISKVSADYELFDVATDKLESNMSFFNSLDGYNVTLPYKQKIIHFLDNLCDKANMYKCVNTVKNNCCSCGYNTDADGFLSALAFEKINPDKNVTIFGCGGAARIFCFELARRGCNVTIVVREKSLFKAKMLANDIKKITNKTININFIKNIPKDIDVFINATPIGMFPNIDDCPISDSDIKNCRAIFDAIYNPIETKLIKKARSNGSKVASGISMLVFQAVFAQNIWNKSVFSDDDVFQLILDSKKILKKLG